MSNGGMTDAEERSTPGTQDTNIDTWGTKGFLTAEQSQALIDFSQAVNENDLKAAKFRVETIEGVSLRFLRARQFKVDAAMKLLSECVAKKNDHRAEEIGQMKADDTMKCDIEGMKKFYPHSILGFDKLNRPIFYEQSGKIDVTAITNMTTLKALTDYHFWTMENALNSMFDVGCALNGGTPVISTCAILDFEGLGIVHCSGLCLEHMKHLIAIDNTCYPETLGKMFVVNAPWLAVTTWEIVKRWLDARTQAKIEILGSGPDVTKKLLEYVDEHTLPQKYGGQAPNWSSIRKHIEYLPISRGCDVIREYSVAPGNMFYVDTYLSDGEIDIEVFCVPPSFGEPGTSAKNQAINHNHGTPISEMVPLSKVTLTKLATPSVQVSRDCSEKSTSTDQTNSTAATGSNVNNSASQPVRDLQSFPNPSEAPMLFTVKWTNNTNAFYAKNVTINLYSEFDESLCKH